MKSYGKKQPRTSVDTISLMVTSFCCAIVEELSPNMMESTIVESFIILILIQLQKY